ncbi:MAG: choice-of-anchor A family protein [Clostridia bacterium]|nr:choice-of-anchor A family protein [Clostridia bacterium]
MFKSIKKRLASFLAAVICVSTILPLTSRILSADEGYNGSYDYASVLSQFQCFVEGDLNYASHSVGALVAGGTANLDCFGEGSISASYFGYLASLTNFNSPAWVKDGGIDYLYFAGIDGGLYQKMVNWGRANSFRSNPGYINIGSAFATLRANSADIANQATNHITVANIDEYGTLQVDLANGSNVVIDYEAFANANVVSFIKQDGSDFGPASFAKDSYYISITGVNGNNIDLNFYSKIYVNGQPYSNQNSLKSVLNSSNGGQIYLDGVNLLWNLPDATSVTATQLQGHLLAPNAAVTASGGNYEGGIIAASLYANAEGHFYPYNPNNVPLLSYSNTIKISKVDSNGDFLGGATLKITGKTADGDTIYDFNAATYDASTARSVTVEPDYIIWVSNGSAFTVGKLIEGTYTVEELDAPQGYYTVDPFTFTVNHDKSISFENKSNVVFDGEANLFTVTDKEMPRTVVSLSKQDIDSKGRELSGASMKLTGVDTTGETIIFSERFVTPGIDASEFGYGESLTWTSGSTATTVALLDGTYTLSETAEPVGYGIVTTNFTFTVNSGKVVSSVTDPSYSLDGNLIAMFDELLPTPTPTVVVSISKKDIADSSELPGATLTISGKDVEGNTVTFTDEDVVEVGVDAQVTAAGSTITIVSGKTATKVGLVDGSYTLTETAAPDGYNTVTTIFTFTITDGVISSNVDSKFFTLNSSYIAVFNELKPTPTPTPTPTTEVTISKQDIDKKGPELPGAELSISGVDVNGDAITFEESDIILGKDAEFKSAGDSLVWVSGATATKVNLVDGEYTLTEVYAPEGYVAVTTVFKFTVENKVVTSSDVCDNFTANAQTVALYDELYVEPTKEVTPVPTVAVSVSKQDIDNKGSEIPGAELKLTGVNASGEDIIFTDDNIVLGTNASLNATGSSLVWTSGNSATKVNLVDGSYTLTETVAPEGYEGTIVNTVFKFTVVDGVVSSSEDSEYFTNDKNSIALFNALIPTPVPTVVVSVSKQDIDNKGTELPGATLEISGTDANGEVVIFDKADVTLGKGATFVATETDDVLCFISGTTSTKIGLVDGTYTLTEVYAPDKYNKVTTVFTFVITDGVVSTSETNEFFTTSKNMIALYNALAPTTVSLSKQDIDSKGSELPGATLELTGKDTKGNVVEFTEDMITLGENATVESTGRVLTFVSGDTATLVDIPNGTYTLKEVYAPNGYDKVATVFSFTVESGVVTSKAQTIYYGIDASSNTVAVFDNLTRTTVTISKQDLAGNGDELPGASMLLTGVDTNGDTVVFMDKNIIVGKDAKVTSAKDSTALAWTSGTTSMKVKLVDGTYTLKEEVAPNGYDIVTTEFTFVVENGVVTTSEVSDNFSASKDVVVFFNELTPVVEPDPTPEITEEPTPEVTEVPTPEVTEEPTPEVTEIPTPEVTEEPTPEVTEIPTPEVTEEPTPEVTEIPTPEVTEEPTPEVTEIPTPEVTEEPTPEVTEIPTPEVTEEPTPEVTEIPTPEVTEEPTPEVTEIPTPVITEEPTPSVVVTEEPTPEVIINKTPVNLSKQDLAGNGDELPGATMSLSGVDSNGYTVKFDEGDVILPDDATLVEVSTKFVWTSGSKAAIVNLVDGTYVLKEEVAPNGYDIVTTSFVFTVKDGVVSASAVSDNYTITGNTIALFDALITDPSVDEPTPAVTDEPRPTFVEPATITPVPTQPTVDITVVVVTEEGEEPIEKAEIIVIDKITNTIVTSFETDTEGSYVIEKVPVGDYIILQKTTRDGYDIDEEEHSAIVVGATEVVIDGIITTQLTIYNPTSIPEVTPNPTPAKSTVETTSNHVTVTRTGETISWTFVLAIASFVMAALVLFSKYGRKHDETMHV